MRDDIPISQGEPVGRQDRAVPMNQDSLDAEQRGNLAGMLSACAAEASQSECPV